MGRDSHQTLPFSGVIVAKFTTAILFCQQKALPIKARRFSEEKSLTSGQLKQALNFFNISLIAGQIVSL